MARKTGLWSLSWGWRARNMCRGEHNSQYWPNSSTRQGLRTYSFPWACYMKLDCLIPLATKNLFCCLHFIPYLNWCHLLSILGLSGNNNISEYPTGLCMLALFFRHDLPNFLCNCYCFFYFSCHPLHNCHWSCKPGSNFTSQMKPCCGSSSAHNWM